MAHLRQRPAHLGARPCQPVRHLRLGGPCLQAYIVFAADAFALLGLRALFFLVTGLLDRLVYLSAGLSLILAFIGVKLILHWGHGLSHQVPEISTPISLAVIAAVLTITTIASLIRSRRDPTAQAHAGAVLGTPPRARPAGQDCAQAPRVLRVLENSPAVATALRTQRPHLPRVGRVPSRRPRRMAGAGPSPGIHRWM